MQIPVSIKKITIQGEEFLQVGYRENGEYYACNLHSTYKEAEIERAYIQNQFNNLDT